MALEDLPGTAEYLTNAAHLLRMTAPDTSAHLMSSRNQILCEHGVQQPDVQRQLVCGGCGLISVYPNHCKTIKPRVRKSLSKYGKAAGSRTVSKTITTNSYRMIRCSNCERETRIPLPPPGPAVHLKAKPPARTEKPPVALKPTANASSKKRAKNRKAGLQALLSGQQKQGANPLSLANFMK